MFKRNAVAIYLVAASAFFVLAAAQWSYNRLYPNGASMWLFGGPAILLGLLSIRANRIGQRREARQREFAEIRQRERMKAALNGRE